jgi:hypothetical protein
MAITPLELTIISVQPDRDHAVLDVVGRMSEDGLDELRQRLDGLLVAGVRYLLVDLTRAEPSESMLGVLASTTRRLQARQGWLRVHRDPLWSSSGEVDEATLPDLFELYQATIGTRRARRWHVH